MNEAELGFELKNALARIEALEAQIAEDTIRLAEDTDAMEEATTRIKTQRDRIEALEAALRVIAEQKTQESYDALIKTARKALAPEQNK